MNTIKLRADKYLIPATMWEEGKRTFIQFPYNKILLAEIKAMQGAKWHGFDENPRKVWSFPNTARNRFQFDFLLNKNPYARYDLPIPKLELPPRRHAISGKEVQLFKHQPVMIGHMLTRRQCIVAAEMGTSKTLAAITAMELADAEFRKTHDFGMVWWYVAPRSALKAVERELRIWGCKVQPELMTYEGLVKRMKAWEDGSVAPNGVIYDEASKLKNATSQRSQAAQALADGIRQDWPDGYVILMSGSPAPKSPADWWSQAEIACPGFLKEGDIYKFKTRLAVIEQKESITGGAYPQLITWRDSEAKCNVCGLLADDPRHNDMLAEADKFHAFVPGKNEVAHLYKRLQGLVIVYFKKDCLDLPDKFYRIIEVKPNPSLLRAAKLIAKSSPTTIQALTLLRELSDGFQYVDTADGKQVCARCNGSKEAIEYDEVADSCPNCKDAIRDEYGKVDCPNHIPQRTEKTVPCPRCGGTGEETHYSRSVKDVPCPKDQVLLDLLEEHEDVGRIVIYAGFTGSIDRCVALCHRADWTTIRVDGRGWSAEDPKGNRIPEKDLISLFQDKKGEFQRVAFVAHPGSAGMGLTLTASPTIVYFSNDFNAESRIQSEDRIHRPGMDVNRGATIIDIVHLETDRKILENLKAKRDLQALTLGELERSINNVSETEERGF